MELPCHEGEIPIPINSIYGGEHAHGHGHLIHHHHPHHHDHGHPPPPPPPPPAAAADTPPPPPQISSTNGATIPLTLDHHHNHHHDHLPPFKKMVRYKECLKNHAASMGGNATDGCGEFMPSGEEGSIEALTCSACNCHRNFHRKEVEGEAAPTSMDCFYNSRVGRKMILGHQKNILAPEAIGYATPTGTLVPSRIAAAAAQPYHHQIIMPYNNMGGSLPSESDEQEDGGGVVLSRPPQLLAKKRFRTKFSQEQKEKMLNFAEKIGWKMQKQEEAMVQQFCQEIGVKRRVLKVWMHNNKHNLAKKNLSTTVGAAAAAAAVAATTTTSAI